MTRGKLGLVAATLFATFVSGCGWHDRPLLSRRSRGCEPECPCPPYMNGGATAMPCSMPGGGFPGMMPGPMMPGAVMPGGPEFTQPPPNGFPIMPNPNPGTVTPGNGTPPGSATPKPADPSDPASAKKNAGVASNAKPAAQ